MANWSGASRSNYVRVADIEGLKKSLANWEIEIVAKGDKIAMFPQTEDGSWPSWRCAEDEDGPHEVEFDFGTDVMPYVAEGEVLVVMTSGAEKLRYITGNASAYVRRGDKVEVVSIGLYDIYAKAATTFGVDQHHITAAEY